MGWVDRIDESQKGERENWRDKGFAQSKKEEARSFSTVKEDSPSASFDVMWSAAFDPVRRQTEELNKVSHPSQIEGIKCNQMF
jgi:hypothetical protein